MRIALLAVSVGCAFSWQAAVAPRPAVRGSVQRVLPRAAPAVAMAMEYDKLRETLMPADNQDTFRNALGLQPFIWGIYSSLKPAQSASMFLGVTALSGLTLTLFKLVAMMHNRYVEIRGFGPFTRQRQIKLRAPACLGRSRPIGRYVPARWPNRLRLSHTSRHIVTGAQMCRDEESKAATTGMLLFAGWALLLRSAVAAGTLGAVARTSGWWCTAMALVAARKLGFSTSGLLFAGSWTALLQTSLFAKVLALPMLPFLISRDGAAKPKPAAAKPAAANPAGAKPAGAKPVAKAAPKNVVPTTPAPPGFKYDSFGTLIVNGN